MNKKLLAFSIIVVFMLLAISFASSVSSNTTKTIEKKESPLFGIRTRQAIKEKIGDIIENIKAKYIGERVFFLPFQWLNNREKLTMREQLQEKTSWDCTYGPTNCPMCTYFTCEGVECTWGCHLH